MLPAVAQAADFPSQLWGRSVTVSRTASRGNEPTAATFNARKSKQPRLWLGWFIAALAGFAVIYGIYRTTRELSHLHHEDYLQLLQSAGLTFLRVNAALVIGALWTVPIGVAIGFLAVLATAIGKRGSE